MGPLRCRTLLVLVALVGLAGLVVSPDTGAAPPPVKPAAKPAPPPALEGTVVGPDGKPVKDALVVVQLRTTLFATSEPALTVRTDAAGRFRVPVKTPAFHMVRVEAAGLAARTLPRARPGEALRIALEKGGAIEGIVRDGTTGALVAGVRIEARAEQTRPTGTVWERGAGVVATTSDAKGRFRLEGLPAGLHAVGARGHGLTSPRRQVAVGQRTELYLFPGGGIDGKVTGPDGRGLAAVTIAIENAMPFGARGATDVEVSDARGAFEFLGVEPGLYRLVARHPGFAPAWTTVTVERGGDAQAEIGLGAAHTIVGRLVGTAEQPVAGKVAVAETDGAAPPLSIGPLLSAEAGSDGQFHIDGLPAGAHALSVTAPGYGAKRIDATVGGRQRTTDLGDVLLESGLVLRGRVRDPGGAAVSDARLLLMRGFPSIDDRADGVSDASGAFAIGGLKAGMYRLTARAPGHGSVDREVEPGGEPIDLVLEAAGSVAGLVVDERGKPVETFRVTARIPPRPQGPGSARMTMIGPPRMESISSPDGRFLLDDVPPGTHLVEVTAPERATGNVSDVKVSPGAVTDVGRVVLAAGGIIRGTVADSTGGGVPAAVVSFFGASRNVGSFAPAAEAVTDSAGAFELRGVSAGVVQVSARHPSFAEGSASAEVDPAKDPPEVHIVLQQGGRIEGRARRRDGGALPGAVNVFSRRMGPSVAFVAPTPIGPDGTFTIEHVTAGTVSVMLLSGSGSQLVGTREREVEVLEGQTTVVDFVARDILLTGTVTRAGAPAPNLRLRVFGEQMTVMMMGGAVAPPGGGPQRMTAVTRDDGGYEMLVDDPGSASIRVESADGSATFPQQRIEIPDADSFAFDIALPGGSISGVVVDGETDQPLPRASVSVSPVRADAGPRSGMPSFSTALAGADGRFRLEVEPGEYNLSTRAEGYSSGSETVTVGESGTADIRVVLTRGLSIRGRVADGGGRPMGGLRVAAATGDAARPRLGSVTQTMPDGTFEISGLGAGDYGVIAQSDLGQFALRPGVRAGASDVALTLRPGGRLVVTVIGPDGAPVRGAWPSVHRVSGMVTSGIGGMMGTDARGVVELAVPTGTVELRVVTEGGLERSATVGVAEGATIPVELRLEPRKASAASP